MTTMKHTIIVRVVEPWVQRPDRVWLPGMTVHLSIEDYRAVRGLDYVVREFVHVFGPCVGREYLHAVNHCGRFIGVPFVECTPMPVVGPLEAPEPRVAAPMLPPALQSRRPVVLRGCGCGGVTKSKG